MTTEQTQRPSSPARGQTVGVATYLELAQRQFQTNLRMASTWAAAVTALSESMLAPAKPAHAAAETASESVRSTSGPERAFRLIGGAGVDTDTQHPAAPYWAVDGSPTPSWPRWLNESPTVQPDLFDEAIELLIDDDIKTAS